MTVWRWLRRSRRGRIVLGTLVLLWFGALGLSGFAGADPTTPAPTPRQGAVAAMSWMELTDSHGVEIYAFQISGPESLRDPLGTVWRFLAESTFSIYQLIVSYAIWFVDWVTGFSWFDMIATPAVSVSGRMSMLLGQIHFAEAFMTITAVSAFFLYARGRTSTGLYEVFACCLVFALSVGVLANPISHTSGSDGLVMKSRDIGLEISGALITPAQGEFVLDSRTGKVVEKPRVDTSSDPDELRTKLTQSMVDIFVRQPAQLVNYGRVLDGGPCESVFTDATKGGPYEAESTMKKISGCDAGAAEFAEKPNFGMTLTAIMLVPAGFVIVALAVVMGGAIIVAAANVLFQSIRILVSAVIALLPNGARAGLLQSVGEIFQSLLMITGTVAMLALYQTLLSEVFRSADPTHLPKTFVMVDILLVVMLVLYKKFKANIQATGHRVAQFLAQRPGDGNTPIPAPQRAWSPNLPTAAAIAAAARRHRPRDGHYPPPAPLPTPAASNTGGGSAPTWSVRVTPNTAPTRPRGDTIRTVRQLAGRAVMARVTAGGSTAVRALQAGHRTRQLAVGRAGLARQLEARRRTTALPAAPVRRELTAGPGPRAKHSSTPPSSPQSPTRGGGVRGWMSGILGRRSSGAGYRRARAKDGNVVFVQAPTSTTPAPVRLSRWQAFRRH